MRSSGCPVIPVSFNLFDESRDLNQEGHRDRAKAE
jgi:hypothetical protein